MPPPRLQAEFINHVDDVGSGYIGTSASVAADNIAAAKLRGNDRRGRDNDL